MSLSLKNVNIPLAAAAGQCFLSAALAVQMTVLRVRGFSDASLAGSVWFQRWHKAQTVNAEYNGVIIGMCALFYAAGKDKPARLATDIACAGAFLGSAVFALGVIMGTSKEANADPLKHGSGDAPHPLRIVGALSRYASMFVMAWEAVQCAI